MSRVILMEDTTRGHLIAEAVSDVMEGRETKVQYRTSDYLGWRTPSKDTQLVVFTSKSIEWRCQSLDCCAGVRVFQGPAAEGGDGVGC